MNDENGRVVSASVQPSELDETPAAARERRAGPQLALDFSWLDMLVQAVAAQHESIAAEGIDGEGVDLDVGVVAEDSRDDVALRVDPGLPRSTCRTPAVIR